MNKKKTGARSLKKNVGTIDRVLRFIFASFLVWLGLWVLEGRHGSVVGIAVALTAGLPLYMSVTASCFVFRWFGIHSLSGKQRGACVNEEK